VNLLQVPLPSPSRAQPYSSFFYPIHSTRSHARRRDVVSLLAAPPWMSAWRFASCTWQQR
jgi:hypothetical protein